MVKHPNTVSIFDAGVENDICYMAMEYIEGGETLKVHTKPESLLPIEDAVHITFKCAKALDHAHRKGVIHRDIKPANILLTQSSDVKIVDFGIALVTRPDASSTHVQGYVGSPLYMSPEQVRQDAITSQTDLFSMGVVLYEMLTGRHPFMADNLAAITHRISEESPTQMREIRTNVPEVLETIVRRAIRKSTDDRYKTGLDLAGDLSLVFDELTFSEEDVSDQEKFNQIRDLGFFTDFPPSEIWEVINASRWLEYGPGQPIIEEGDLDNSFFIVISGDALVRKGDADLYVLKEGECFGEMGFISRERRSATIVANSAVWVMKVSASLIERTSINCQFRFQKVFLNTLVSRLKATTEALSA